MGFRRGLLEDWVIAFLLIGGLKCAGGDSHGVDGCGEHSNGANVNCGGRVTSLDALTILQAAGVRIELVRFKCPDDAANNI